MIMAVIHPSHYHCKKGIHIRATNEYKQAFFFLIK